VKLVDSVNAAEAGADYNGVNGLESVLCSHGELLCRSDAGEKRLVGWWKSVAQCGPN
jgi:hypothetical protein